MPSTLASTLVNIITNINRYWTRFHCSGSDIDRVGF